MNEKEKIKQLEDDIIDRRHRVRLNKYWISRYWNRLAYLVIKLGRKMIWDYTKRNSQILTRDEFAKKYTEDIMCYYK